MKFDPHIHRRCSLRLAGYDYRRNGAYFVTLCTYERQCLFGEVNDSAIELSRFGDILLDEWLWTPVARLDVSLDAYVIMPDHLHGIIVLHGGDRDPAEGPIRPKLRDGGVQAGSLGAIVGQVKAITARRINRLRGAPGAPVWQRGYYDHIICNDADLARIRTYIEGNMARWRERDESAS